MNADRLFTVYDRVADAPDAVGRLRRFVLDLAVRGNLVEQDPADEPASELLRQIEVEKARLVKTGEIRKPPALIPIVPAEQLFGLPSSWEWASSTYPALGISSAGKKIKTKDVLATGVYPVVDQGKTLVRGYCNDPDRVLRVSHPLIIFGDHTREIKLIDFDFVVGADGVKILQPIGIDARYYYLALRWLPLQNRGYSRHYRLLRSSFVPVPPLAEQRRIVAKVDELMALCDQLEEARTARDDTCDRLTKASLTRLTKPDTDAPTFRSHARFAVDAFSVLTGHADQVKHLRQTILCLAVRGKLVGQDSSDEPASVLLKRIVAERERLVEARVIRKPKPIEVLDEPPFAIPLSWKWTRLGELAELVRGVSFPASAKSNKPAEGLLPCLRSGNIQTNTDWNDLIYVPESVVKNADKLVKPGDVLISIANSYALVGKCSIVSALPYRATFGAFLAAIRFLFVLPEYARSFLQSGFSSSAFRVGSSQTTNIANITFSTIRRHPFPLPPLAEQRRIVAKVAQLMALCDRMEVGLDAASDTRDRLLDALVHESLGSHDTAVNGDDFG